jgi:Uma2 family endonuclease
MTVELVRHRFTNDDVERMLESGILGPEDRVELIAGELIEMSPKGARHTATIIRLTELFSELFAGRALVSVQNDIVLGPLSRLEPDILLLRRRADYYHSRTPTAENALLLVEVAGTALRYDREVKVPLYAAAGVPEVWIVDLVGEVVEVYEEPAGERYRQITRYAAGEQMAPRAFPNAWIDVAALFPSVESGG